MGGVVVSRTGSGPTLYYGCLFRVRKLYRLQQQGEFGTNNIREPSAIRLSGRFVAYPQDYGSTGGEASTLSVRDLRTGVVKYQASIAQRGGDFDDSVTRLVLKLNGSVAWTTRTGGLDGTPTVEVRAMDLAGAPRLVASSPAISATSLRLAGDHRSVSWLEAGVRHSAALD